MPTPLFPEDIPDVTTTQDQSPLSIIQGRIGSCYLLASLDCIAKGNIALLKSLFVQEEDGVWVTLRRVRTHTPNLNQDNIQDKYIHQYNPQTGEDRFFIRNAQLEIIDNTSKASKSNALAVKILEHLTSYYFTVPWSNIPLKPQDQPSSTPTPRIKRSASVEAHDLPHRFDERESHLVADMLGVKVVSTTDVERIRIIKQAIYPEEPIYVSMERNDPHRLNPKAPLHAFRVHTIESHPDIKDHFVLWLFNPWDNQMAEKHVCKKEQIIEFSLFETNAQRFRVLNLLLKSPTLLDLVTHLKIADPRFKPEDILIENDDYIDHHLNYLINTQKTRLVDKFVRKIQRFTVSFDELYTEEAINTYRDDLIDSLIDWLEKSPQLSALYHLLNNEYPLAIKDACVKKKEEICHAAGKRLEDSKLIEICFFKIDKVSVTFSRETTVSEVQIRQHVLEDHVRALSSSSPVCQIINDCAEKKLSIIKQQSSRRQEKINTVENYLQSIAFTEQLLFIKRLVDLSQTLAKNNRDHRIKAFYGQAFHTALNEAKKGLITSPLPWKDRLLIFKNNTLLALDQARQHLAPYADWMKITKQLNKIIRMRESPTRPQSSRSSAFKFFSRQKQVAPTLPSRSTTLSVPANPGARESTC